VGELRERLEVAVGEVDDREAVGERDEHARGIRRRRRGADLRGQADGAVLAAGGVVLVQRAAVDVDPQQPLRARIPAWALGEGGVGAQEQFGGSQIVDVQRYTASGAPL
jgi:hypothetical protein